MQINGLHHIYLKKMKQFVSVSGHISSTQLIETSVPQGSVLGFLRCFLSSRQGTFEWGLEVFKGGKGGEGEG